MSSDEFRSPRDAKELRAAAAGAARAILDRDLDRRAGHAKNLSREIVIAPSANGHYLSALRTGAALELDFSWDPDRAGAASESFARVLNRSAPNSRAKRAPPAQEAARVDAPACAHDGRFAALRAARAPLCGARPPGAARALRLAACAPHGGPGSQLSLGG